MNESQSGSNASGDTLDEELAAACAAVEEYGPASIEMLLDRIEEQEQAGVPAATEIVFALMQACKHARGFRQMLEIGEIFGDRDDPSLALLVCQARIDTGDHRSATRKLKRMLADVLEGGNQKLASETLGLLGRAHKQEFVEQITMGDTDRAADALRDSVECYEQAYPLDRAWHGANLAALVWRAEHEKIDLPTSGSAVGQRLLQDLGNPSNPDPWTVAALAQGYMAQNDWDSGYSRYEEYFRRLRKVKGRSAAFALYGDIRQLNEIWLANSGTVPGATEISEMLHERMASTALPGCNSGEVTKLLTAIGVDGVDPEEELQAIVASGEIIPVDEMCRVVENRHVVAKVTDSSDPQKGGTGFLIDAKPFGLENAHAVFVTNNHVVATQLRSQNQIHADDAVVSFESWAGSGTEDFRINKVLAESPCEEYDVTIAVLEHLPEAARFAVLKSPEERFLSPQPNAMALGRVHPFGHPGHGPLCLSLAGNEVIDHDLFKGHRGVRRMHYRANTKKGYSGGPVFGKSGHVVAVHRATTQRRIEGTPVRHGPNYNANEGVGIGCIVSWVQSQ